MDRQQRDMEADLELHRAVAAFEESAIIAPDLPASALPALVSFFRALGDIARFALEVTLDSDRTDPIHLQPRILRSA